MVLISLKKCLQKQNKPKPDITNQKGRGGGIIQTFIEKQQLLLSIIKKAKRQ